MDVFARALALTSAGVLGIYAGTMLTEGFVFVPYWRELAPAEFFAWYARNDARLIGFFGPVTIAGGLLPIMAATALFLARRPGRALALVAALLMLVAIAMFFAYFEAANASFASASIAGESLPAELARWAFWHHVRTAISLVALAAALGAAAATRRP